MESAPPIRGIVCFQPMRMHLHERKCLKDVIVLQLLICNLLGVHKSGISTLHLDIYLIRRHLSSIAIKISVSILFFSRSQVHPQSQLHIHTMRSPTCILAVALGLLSSPTVASKCDNVAIERLPVFATSDGPFILRAQEGFNVVVKYHAEHKTFIPVLTKSNHLPEFLLTHGNITSADGSIAGFYPPSPAIFPPVLLPLLFGKEVGSKNGADLVAVTRTRSDGSGRSVLRIFPLDGRELAC